MKAVDAESPRFARLVQSGAGRSGVGSKKFRVQRQGGQKLNLYISRIQSK